MVMSTRTLPTDRSNTSRIDSSLAPVGLDSLTHISCRSFAKPGAIRDARKMIVLALNCGSSSVKFRVFDVTPGPRDKPTSIGKGFVERIGRDAVASAEMASKAPRRETIAIADH